VEDAKIITALLGDHVPAGTASFGALRSHIEAGSLRPLTVFLDEKLSQVPDVPSIAELGYDMPYVSSMGLYGPRGLPDSVVKRLEDAIKKVTEDSSFKEKAKQLGVQVAYRDSAGFGHFINKNKATWKSSLKRWGI